MKRCAFAALLFSFVICSAVAAAPKSKSTEPDHYKPAARLRHDRARLGETQVELTETGKALADKYAAMLGELQAEIEEQLPQISDSEEQAVRDALARVKVAEVVYEIKHMGWRLGYLNSKTSLQSSREKLQDVADRLADAELALENAKAMPDGHELKAAAVEDAAKQVEKRKKELEKLPADIARAEQGAVRAEERKAELAKDLDNADKALQAARQQALAAAAKTGAGKLLASDKLDGKLVRSVVISEATPYWLAVYAQQGAAQQAVIEQLLEDEQLMTEMLIADGPVWDKFGQAVEIYRAIQKANPRANEGLFRRLALAVALEHAVPIIKDTPESAGEEPQYIDPLNRYQSYEKAYLADELDPIFAGLSTWSLRMVVDGSEPDEISAWGRQMLRNFRPDLIALENQGWRYVKSVDTEINYTSKWQKLGWDRPDLQQYQNILANGGICGRRAFFGRFILRAFGVPTTARSQPGHAALVRATPDGWVPCLGGGWGASNRGMFYRYVTDLDFLASSQAREASDAFMQVKRALWIGQACGEESTYGYRKNLRRRDLNRFVNQPLEEVEVPGFWHCVGLIGQNLLIEKLQAASSEALGEDIGESNEHELREGVDKVEIPASERKITVNADGKIYVPAAACSTPTNNTDVIRFMPSNLGGMQLHISRYTGTDTIEYEVEAPAAGKYNLTARLVTPAPKQHLFLKVNGSDERIDIALPYTVGMWDELEPVEVELKAGKNVLKFYRNHYFQRGVTIRDFTLTPAK